MKFAWVGDSSVVVDLFGIPNGVKLVSSLEIPQSVTLEEALKFVWKNIRQEIVP